jgi:hypothetical protein
MVNHIAPPANGPTLGMKRSAARPDRPGQTRQSSGTFFSTGVELTPGGCIVAEPCGPNEQLPRWEVRPGDLCRREDTRARRKWLAWRPVTFQPITREIIRESRVFARLHRQIMLALSSKYSLAYYEMIQKRGT